MQILLTGATGFIGQALVPRLKPHQLTILTRTPSVAINLLGKQHQYLNDLNDLDHLNHFDAIINLAGEPIAEGRWSKKKKAAITESRCHLTQQLVDLAKQGSRPPACWINASAIGIYGAQPNDVDCHEQLPNSINDFAAQVCYRWEQIAQSIQSEKTRLCILRIGLVLHPDGGALKKMLPAFRFGVGGSMGTGQQMMSWIHREDLIRLILFLLHSEQCSGIFNATSPHPVVQTEFARTLGSALHRPAYLPTPAWLLKLLLGEMSQLLLTGAAIRPKKALESGFQFHYPNLAEALTDLCQSKP